jgi:amino acid transporter
MRQVSYIFATQLMTPLDAAGCTSSPCPPNTVDLNNFDASDGPRRFSLYTLVITSIAVSGALLFTRFLPRQREQCHEWKKEGEEQTGSNLRGAAVVVVTTLVVAYGVLGSVLLLIPSTSCYAWIGGEGCR